MSLILWIIIGIILVFFIVTTLWIIFIFLKNSKRDYNLYKSVAKSVFARKLSLSIIVIFYMISFGLVGGLTSALGRLNKEATDYIKENHLHQGVAKQTYFANNNFGAHTFDQKSFYLATQGVIDFYNENIIGDEHSSETSFLNMLGGQDVNDDGILTLKEILDGSTSPLSYESNLEGNSVCGHNFSIHDIGIFWNTWYYGTDFVYDDPVGEGDSEDHWKTYRYNGDLHTYGFDSDGHNENEIITNIEKIANNTIFYGETKYWTFENAISDEFNGLDTFSEVVFVFFDNNINKYFSTIGTFFFEYYLDLYYDENNLFASSDVYEYQETFRGTDFLLQSYNKNQVSNANSVFNNSGIDENGDYSVDTVTFYDNKGKEIIGPNENDDFFEHHEGTTADPYLIYVSTEYYETHNWSSLNVGESWEVPGYGFSIQVEGSYRSPTYSFPMQTVSDSLQNPENNAAILINTQSLLRLTRNQKNSTTNYEFFGFSNIYDATNKASDWYYLMNLKDSLHEKTFYPADVNLFSYSLNSFYGDSSWPEVTNGEGIEVPQTFNLDVESINELKSIISYRSYTIIREIYTDNIIYSVIMGIFLLITIMVLILLIRKRIQDSNKQLGTIKALGYNPSRIASAYTIFPIIIILVGGIMALAVALPLSLLFTSLYSGFFSLNLASPYVGITIWLKIFIIPLIISMFIGYWMAYHTIKKPTIDLLNNVGNDKPNWLVRGTSHLIPSFASFEFTYKTKGIGRAFFKSLLLFCAILGSMSITSFAFASSTMTATMTKQVFDIIDYKAKKWEFGAPFIEDININDVNDEYGTYDLNDDIPNEMEAFDLFPDSESSGKLIIYVSHVLSNPYIPKDSEDVGTLKIFQDLLETQYGREDFDFSFEINYDTNDLPTVISNYYITWKTAVALWATDIALHVPIDNKGAENPELKEKIISEKTLTFNMLDPILRDYAVNISANVVVRYGKDATFKVINFVYKLINDYESSDHSDFKKDLEIISDWFFENGVDGITEFIDYIKTVLENEYIFNDIVFNKNYYDGIDKEGVEGENINQTMTTATSGYFLKTDLKGNLIPNNEDDTFDETTTYMEGYTSTEELTATNNIGSDAIAHIEPSSKNGVVNVAMTKSESKEVKRYKAATSSIQKDINGNPLPKNQARIFVQTKVWDKEEETYKEIYVPVIFDIEIYDSIYPLGSFFLQDNLDAAINYSLDNLPNNIEDEPWYIGYGDFVEQELAIAENAAYEHNYSVTYNIDTSGEDFITAPFSVSLSQGGLIALIDNEKINEEIEFVYMVNNVYIPFSIPLSINLIIDQGSRVYKLLQGIFYIVAFFALFIGITVVMIAMKDIMDSNKREVSMFKAFGYSNARATSLVITPYLFVIVLAFIIAIPISLVFLSAVGTILTLVTGTTYVFALVLWQWIVVVGFIIGLVIFLGFVGYQSYLHTNALEAINETNE